MSVLTIKKSSKGSQNKPLIIIISKKVYKNATDRNLMKRRIKSIATPLLDKLDKDLKIIVSPKASSLTFEEIKRDIHESII